MQKVKILLVIFFSGIICFGITANAQDRGLVDSRYQVISKLKLYDTVNQELYEFDNQKTMDLFLQSQRGGISLRNYPINERRTRTLRSWKKLHTSRHLLNKSIAGGPYGGSMSISNGITITVEGMSTSVEYGTSYNIPPRKTGNIVMKTKVKYTEHRIEQRPRGSNKPWQFAGQYTSKKIISSWYAPVYW